MAQSPLHGRLWDAYFDDHDRRLGERAVASGRLTAEQLRDALSADPERSLGDVLVARGLLTRSQLAVMEHDLAREDFTRPLAGDTPTAPPEVAAASLDPQRRLAEFILVEKLARGGAGQVWRAWDTGLGRWVAIKLPAVALDSAAARARFQREALAVARLSHPNLLALHRVGDHDGRPFLVMPLVEGATLQESCPSLPDLLAIMRTVALAVDHAHRQGVVHRDIKPANIMIDRDGRVFVLDFGLAFLLHGGDSAGVTAPGAALGTAAYMSPEQARGNVHAREPTTDVYGLGATLYHLATGSPPFPDESFAATIGKVIHDVPPAPRAVNPRLPPDLDTVIRKAMEKDPAARYASAADLAEDLRRIADGEPIRARPAGPLRRVAAFARRRPVLFVTGIAAAILLGGAAAARAFIHYERLAAVDDLRNIANFSMDTALRLRRAGDLTGMREAARPLAAAYARARVIAPDLAEIDYLMGRMHRTVLNYEAALPFQERALAIDPDFIPALYERAVLMARAYGWGVHGTRSGPVRVLDADIVQTVRAYPDHRRRREIAARDIERMAARAAPEVDLLAARGILALHDMHFADAARLLGRAAALDPTREEIQEHLTMALGALRRFDEAEKVYTAALERDRGFFPYLLSRCRMRIESGRYDDAVGDADRGLAIAPRDAQLRLCRAAAQVNRARAAVRDGRDPTVDTQRARADAESVRNAPETWGEPWTLEATSHWIEAEFLLRRGGDPLPAARAALAATATAKRGGGGLQDLSLIEGRVSFLIGLAHAAQGRDPIPAFADARRALDQAVTSSPASYLALQIRGDLLAHWARWNDRHGRDSSAEFAAAVSDLDRSAGLRESPWTLIARGRMHRWAGVEQGLRGQVASDDLMAAAADLERATTLAPKAADAWLERGRLALVLRDAKQARAFLDRAFALDPHLRAHAAREFADRAARGVTLPAAETAATPPPDRPGRRHNRARSR